MATAAIPIHKLSVDSTLGTSLSRSSALPGWIRKPLKAWLMPRVLNEIVSSMSNESIAALTAEQANELYPALRHFHMELTDVLATCSKSSWVARMALKPFVAPLYPANERLGDIVEALAWSQDEELRAYVSSSVAKIEYQLR